MTGPRKLVTPLGLCALVLAAAVVILDQLSKWWVLNALDLPERGQIPVLPFFRLSMVMNRGVSYGLLRADNEVMRWLLVAGALAVVVWLVYWVRNTTRPWFATAIGLVIGGALGNNLIDRVRLGHVTDFLDFSGLGFPWVFNVADSAISVGVALLLLDVFLLEKPAAGKAPEKLRESATDKPA
jgi:signal peptidase II